MIKSFSRKAIWLTDYQFNGGALWKYITPCKVWGYPRGAAEDWRCSVRLWNFPSQTTGRTKTILFDSRMPRTCNRLDWSLRARMEVACDWRSERFIATGTPYQRELEVVGSYRSEKGRTQATVLAVGMKCREYCRNKWRSNRSLRQ
jgi:hypothetical protein